MAKGVAKNVADGRKALGCSEAEWKARVELAACYRQSARMGITDLIFTHMSARVPGEPEHFLVNPNGLLYEEITASCLVKMDMEGRVLADPMGLGHLPGGFSFHSAVYLARSDAVCAIHNHTDATIAVGAQEKGLLAVSQHAIRFHGLVAYMDYPGFVSAEEERVALGRALGDRKVLMLRNHGTLITGNTIRDAFIHMYFLEAACRHQVTMQSCGVPFSLIPEDIAAETAKRFANAPPVRQRDWPALLRQLDRDDPSYAS